MLTVLVADPALAGFDGTGPAIPADSDDVAAPLLTWRARRPRAGATSFSALTELAASPLVRTVYDPATETLRDEALIGGLAGVRLGGRYALSDRIELAGSVPLWGVVGGVDGVGPGALGDLTVSVPIGLVEEDQGSLGLAASVIPFGTLPTGAQARYLGDRGPSLGAWAAGEATLGRFVATGNLGLVLRSFEAEDNVRPGPGLVARAGLGWRVFDPLGLHASWRGNLRLLPGEEVVEAAPRRVGASELALSARVIVFDRWYTTFGLAGQTQRGPGAAAARAWLGLGGSFGGDPPVSARPLTPLTLVLTDPDGRPVEGASVLQAGVPVGVTDAAGELTLSQRWAPDDELDITAAGLEPLVVVPRAVPVDESGAARAERVLPWAPVEVEVYVQDAEGRPLAASIFAEPVGNASDPADDRVPTRPITLGGAGSHALELPPGAWTMHAELQGYGAQERGIRVLPRAPGEQVRFILRPTAGDRVLDLSVVDVAGEPVGGAEVDLGGQPVGTTGSGGTMRIGGLAPEPFAIDAHADTFRELTRPGVVPGEAPVRIVLARERGAVQVVVRDAEGLRVEDASARFLGADRLGPFALGRDGARTFVLRPGPWQLLVSSPAHGLQQRALEIPDQDTALQEVEVVLQPPEDGTTDLTLRLIDRDNRPIPGAAITLDGQDYGTTSSGGELALADLTEGERTLTVRGDWLEPVDESLQLTGGLQEHTIVADWRPGTTLVLARGRGGMVGDATARFQGPAPVDPTPLGLDGIAYLSLAAGDWQALVSSPSLGLHQAGVRIPEDSRTLHVVDAVLNAGEDGDGRLTVEVVGPDGQPVSGARIALDGLDLGATASSGTLGLSQLGEGRRELRVEAKPYGTVTRPIVVEEEGGTQRVRLDWGVGAVRVSVVGEGAPVSDARLRLGGPRFVPSTPVQADGTRLFALSPGTWRALAASPRFAPEEATLEVPDTPGLTELTLSMEAPPAGVAELVVRVQDADGEPVPGATLRVDERPAIQADQGLAVLSAEPGPHRLEVRAPRFEPRVLDEVDLQDGLNELILELAHLPRRLNVKVVGPDGPVSGAQIRLDGPADVPAVQTDVRGLVSLDVRPGAWTVLASAPELGTRAAEVELALQDDAAVTVTLELSPARVEVAGADLTIEDTLYFDVGKASLKPASTSTLDEVAATLRAHPEIVRLVVEGHTDPTGGVAFNLALSRDRAEAVVDALVQRGVAPERLDARGFGPTRPVQPNDTEEGRAANRRVELRGEVGEAVQGGATSR